MKRQLVERRTYPPKARARLKAGLKAGEGGQAQPPHRDREPSPKARSPGCTRAGIWMIGCSMAGGGLRAPDYERAQACPPA